MLETTLHKYVIYISIFAAVLVAAVVVTVLRLHTVTLTHFKTIDPYS